MNEISEIELYKVKKVLEQICENILGIPKDAAYIKQDGDSYGIYCVPEYFDEFYDYMMSLDGWKPVK